MGRIAVIIALLIFVTPALAEEKAKTGADPTDFITRIEPSYEFKRIKTGTPEKHTIDLNLLVVRSDVALTRDLSFRMDLPLIHLDPGSSLEALGVDDKIGLGDIVTQLLYKPYSDADMAFLVGLRIDWPSATKDVLGAGGIVYAPMGVAAFFPSRKWIVAGVFQWFLGNNLDNDPFPGKRDKNELSIRPIVIYQPMKPAVSWLTLDPELIIDFENSNKTSSTIGLEYGLMLNRTTALFLKPSVKVGDGDGWGVKFGFRFMFPKTVLFE
jgi:hypothetical protein